MHLRVLKNPQTQAVFTIIVNRLEGERPKGKDKDERKSLHVSRLHTPSSYAHAAACSQYSDIYSKLTIKMSANILNSILGNADPSSLQGQDQSH